MKGQLVALSAEGCRIGEQHPRAVLTDHEVGLVLDLLAAGFSYSELATKFDISKSCIAHIATGRRRCQTPERYVPPPVTSAKKDRTARNGWKKKKKTEGPQVNESAIALQAALNSWR